MEVKNIVINGKTISYIIEYSRRRSVGLHIDDESRVVVRMPKGFSVEYAEDILRRHFRWIEKHLEAKRDVPVKSFCNGEMHYYLGNQYPLKISQGEINSIEFTGEAFLIQCVDTDDVADILQFFYRKKAEKIFQKILDSVAPNFAKYGVSYTKMSVRKMRTRWGSCSNRGAISLNLELIKLPENCIRQVIVHEMCHLIYFNHSEKFYDLMNAEMPDWREWKKKLRFL